MRADLEVARLKSSADMVTAIEPAVRLYEEPPTEGMEVATPWADVWLGPHDWAEAFESLEPGTSHNEGRDQVWEELLTILVDKHGSDPEDTDVSEDLIRRALVQNDELVDAFGRAWPLIDPADLVGDLWSVPAYLRRCALHGSIPTRCGCCSAGSRRPGRAPTSRCWTRPGSGSATRRRRGADVGNVPPRPPSARRCPASSTT